MNCFSIDHWDALRLHDEDYPTDTYQCENCDKWFCEDHGQIGGDRWIQGTNNCGYVAVPNICGACQQKWEIANGYRRD